jgi:hypothetical protein
MGYRSFVVLGLVALAGCTATNQDAEDVATTEEGLAADAKVEIKMMLEEVDDGPTILGVDPQGFEARSVTFYDTKDLDLYASGVVLRSRTAVGAEDDTTAKIRPLKETNVARGYVGKDGFKCEYDKNVGKNAVSSCSLKKEKEAYRIERVARGVDTPDEIFSSAQIAFVEAHAAVPNWSEVKPLGPIPAQVWKVETRALPAGDITLERWNVPGGERSLEISIKVKGRDARDAESSLKAWVTSLGLHASSAQDTKTKAALTALTR